jgi:WD40 repeat protein
MIPRTSLTICHRVVAGTYDKKVIMMDKREDQKKITFYKCHSKPVLAVKVTDRLILSLSEDQNLVVYDRTAGKRMKKVEIPGSSFPMCLSLHGPSLYVGDKGGGLHLLDGTYDRFDVVQYYSTGHSGKITSVVHGLGSLITSSTDGDVKVFHPSRNLELIKTLKSPDCGEAANLSYSVRNKILAAAFSNNTVKIWSGANMA